MSLIKKKQVVLVHDYLREFGGAERVLMALHDMFPDAPVYTAFIDKKALGDHWAFFEGWELRQTWLAKLPFIKQLYSPLRVLADRAFASLDLEAYDIVISSSNAYMAKAVLPSKKGIHICYCHTPPRSLYGYSTMTDWKKNPLFRIGGELINHYMRIRDFQVAQDVDYFIANSKETQKRITKFYRRDSVVINPPVDVPNTPPSKDTKKTYFLYVNRLALAKHPELAVQVCSQMNLPLKVVGTGPMLDSLKEMAGETVEFLGAVTDEELHQLYAGARALLYPVEDEDFGIVPVEAMGHGVPVIAHASGGPLETIVEEKTGLFFHELTIAGLKEAIHFFLKYEKNNVFDAKKIYRHAQTFSKDQFQKSISKYIFSLKK